MKRVVHFWLSAMLIMTVMVLTGRAEDIIVLKNGERREGTITAETAEAFRLEFMLTPKIRDRVDIPKGEIAQVIRETPAQAEYRERRFNDLVPSRDLMTIAEYDYVLEKLRLFLSKHRGSPEAARVQDMLASLQGDRERVQAGGLKMEGVWLDAGAVKRERYEIDAYWHRFTMKDRLVDACDTPTASKEALALREFEELRRGCPASMQFVKAIPEALKTLDAYGRKLEQMAKEHPVLTAQRERALKALPSTGTTRDLFLRPDTEISKDLREFQERFEAQTKAGVKWRDVYKYDLRSIELARGAVEKEREQLEAINLTALRFENENLSGARRCLLAGRPAEAEVFMKRLRPMRRTLVNGDAFEELARLLEKETGR